MWAGFDVIVEGVVQLLELTGVAVILASFIFATGHWLQNFRRQSLRRSYLEYRRRSVRGLILGLEFLVAGDIVRTVIMDYSMASLLGLGMMVLIRTFLVFSLHAEIEGRLPWQRSRDSESTE